MRIYIDLDSNTLIRSASDLQPVSQIELKRGDAATFEVQFVRGGVVVEMPSMLSLIFAAKQRGKYDSDPVVYHDAFIAPHTASVEGFLTADTGIDVIDIVDPGAGYDAPPTVSITGTLADGGYPATAVARLAGGVVTAVTVVAAGAGYTALPVITLSAPPPYITGKPNFSTIELDALFAIDGDATNDVPYVDLMAEFAWGTDVTSCRTFTVRVHNNVVRGNEFPTSAQSPLAITKIGDFIFGLPLLLTHARTMDNTGTVTPVPGKWVESIGYSENYIVDNPNLLTSLSFDDLVGVVVNVNPYGMAALTTLSMPVLTTVGGIFNPYGMAALTTLSMPVLTAVGGTFTLTNMASLTTLSAPSLTTVGGNFNPYGMAALTTLSMPVLTTVGGNFNPFAMALLTTLSAPSLTTVGGHFNLYGMAALTTLSVPSLTAVGGAFFINTMASLTTLSVPVMVSYGSGITIVSASTPNVADVTFGTVGTLKKITGNITLSGLRLTSASVNNLLALLVSLDNTNGTILWGSGMTLTINGGTNAAPSGQGITDKATLIARGCTITTN